MAESDRPAEGAAELRLERGTECVSVDEEGNEDNYKEEQNDYGDDDPDPALLHWKLLSKLRWQAL